MFCCYSWLKISESVLIRLKSNHFSKEKSYNSQKLINIVLHSLTMHIKGAVLQQDRQISCITQNIIKVLTIATSLLGITGGYSSPSVELVGELIIWEDVQHFLPPWPRTSCQLPSMIVCSFASLQAWAPAPHQPPCKRILMSTTWAGIWLMVSILRGLPLSAPSLT